MTLAQRKLPFVSLFAGAGGLDVGFELAGWSCAYASDLDQSSVVTLQNNRGRLVGQTRLLEDTFIEREDVRNLRGKEILAKSGLRKGDPLALVGGPPCQSWSSAGHQLGFEDPRGQLIRDYVRLAAELDARWLVFENVRGLLTARGPDGEPGSALAFVRNALLDHGYQSEVNLLNAADYGVPQRRVRLFLIGFRRGDRPVFPEATHAREVGLFDTGVSPWVSLGECLRSVGNLDADDIIRPSAALAELLKSLPEGTGLRSEGKRETTRPGGHWGYRQGCFVSDLRLPARTVTASAQQDWIRDPRYGLRRLSPKECSAIQTFPKEWIVSGNRVTQYRQIGNAVPPVMAKAIGSALGQHVTSALEYRAGGRAARELLPLPPRLASAIEYTRKEEARNGESRRAAPVKRTLRSTNGR